MRTLMSPDNTQRAILPHLQRTENMLSAASSAESGRSEHAEIVALPDLGLPHNVRRMHGGFYTGAFYGWSGDVPIVPVDATVNVCGVSVFRTTMDPSDLPGFLREVGRARTRMEQETAYSWNWNTGNHFATLTEVREPGALPEGRYLVLHASTAEFKKQYNGLYPEPRNWYADHVKTIWGENGRYLRYLSGKQAEQFYQMAEMLVEYQKSRQRICAELICGAAGIDEEILSVPHYGMPDQNSVAIGCQWLEETNPNYLLLTRPEAPLFWVSAAPGGLNAVSTISGTRLLTPHGLGVKGIVGAGIEYHEDHLVVGGVVLPLDLSLAGHSVTSYRSLKGLRTVEALLDQCPGTVGSVLHQIYSHYRTGQVA